MAPVISLLAFFSFAAQDSFDQDVRKLLDEGHQAYLTGKYDEAFVKFQEAFNKNPSSPVVYAFLKRAGEDVIASMINSTDPRLRDTGRMIFALAKPGEAIRRDPAVIDGYLNDLGATEADKWQLAFWHLKNIGPYAVTSLVPTLGKDTSDRLRPRVILLLTEMHTDATLGVIEALHADSILMRQNAAIVLGNIRDERAIPYLKWMIENPNEKPEVKKFAHESLTKITGRDDRQWKSSTQYFMELAEKYYYSHPTAILRWQPNDVIWTWDAAGQAVKQRDVPSFAFNEQMCEETLYDLLDLDSAHAGGWGLMAANHFAQDLEARSNLAAAEVALGLGDIQQADVDRIKTLIAGVDRAKVLGHLVNRPYLYQALSRSLTDGRSEVAVAVIEALGMMALPEDVPSAAQPVDPTRYGGPLVAALTHEDKVVRYAAARVLTKMNPQFPTLGRDLVMPNLIDALGEQGIRTVLMVHEAKNAADFQWINGWTRMLTRLSSHVSAARDIPSGLEKAMGGPREDVILLQYELAHTVIFSVTLNNKKTEERLYDQLKNDVRTREIPRVLICRTPQQLAEAQQIYADAAGFLLQTAASPDVEAVLNKIADAAGDKAKKRADALAQAAAETLAALDVDNTMYPYGQTRDALMGAGGLANKRQPAIRIPAARALGHYGDPAAADVLADALNEKSDPKEVRLATAEALSEIYRRSGAPPTEKVFTVLRDTLNDGDLDIELAAAHALGNVKLSLEQRRELEKFKRIKRGS